MPHFPPSAPRIGIALAAIGVLATTAVAANAAIRTETRPVDPAATAQPASTTTVATTPETTVVRSTSSSSGGSPATVTTRRQPATTQKPKSVPPASGQQAVLAFTAAIDRGDAAAAWRVLAPRSQTFWRSQARFAASMDKLQQGGWAGWTADRGRTARSVVINSSGDGEVLIVTLRGTTELDGRKVLRATAFPVRHVKGSFLVELWDVGVGETTPEVVAPAPEIGTVRTSDRRPTFRARAQGNELAWALDDRDATFTSVSGGVASYQPERALTTGTHVLTLASQGPGWLQATAVVVEVLDH
jgi:hypothetical protein